MDLIFRQTEVRLVLLALSTKTRTNVKTTDNANNTSRGWF